MERVGHIFPGVRSNVVSGLLVRSCLQAFRGTPAIVGLLLQTDKSVLEKGGSLAQAIQEARISGYWQLGEICAKVFIGLNNLRIPLGKC